MNEQTLFLEALDQPAGEERQQWLEKKCQDLDQRERIFKLLKQHESAGNFLERPHAKLLRQAGAAAKNPPQDQSEVDSSSRIEKTITKAKFVDRLIRSKLMTAEEVEEYEGTLEAARNASDARSFAQALVDANALTSFQAKAIYEARIKGLTFGEYIILDQLGKGGMGIVYRARHRRMDRLVAIKVLPRFAMATKGMVGRFYREVKTAGKLMHPNIVAALDASEDDGLHYLVMEYVDGRDLREVLQQSGPLDLKFAVDCIVQAARGFQYAHEQGVIHRDIKPANLLIDGNGIVKILDMGLARATRVVSDDLDQDAASGSSAGDLAGTLPPPSVSEKDTAVIPILAPDTTTHFDETRLTEAGEVMGTLDYMSPEQFTDSHNVDERGDIYSLGCTLYRLLTDHKPFAANSVGASFKAHQSAPIPSLRDFRPDVPERLDMVFQRMLAKEPAGRQSNMSEVIAELEEVLTHQQAFSTNNFQDTQTGFSSEQSATQPDAPAAPSPSDALHLRASDRPKRRRSIPIGWIATGSLALSLLAVFALTQSQFLRSDKERLASNSGKSSGLSRAAKTVVAKPKPNGNELPLAPATEPANENNGEEAARVPLDAPTTEPKESQTEPEQAITEDASELRQSQPSSGQPNRVTMVPPPDPALFPQHDFSFPGFGTLPQGNPFPTNQVVRFNEDGKRVGITQNKDGITVSVDGRVIEAADPAALKEKDPTAYRLYQRVFRSPNMRQIPISPAVSRQREQWENLLKQYSNNPQMKLAIERMLRAMEN